MSVSCPHCGSTAAVSRGTRQNVDGLLFRRYACKGCSRYYSVQSMDKFQSTSEIIGEKFVITSAQNDTPINLFFLMTLKSYCSIHGATLIILPVKYMVDISEPEIIWHPSIAEYIKDSSVTLTDGLRMLGNINISPAIESPIAGLDYLSKGDSLIIGHPQLQMKTLAVNSVDHPAIITTTGSVTLPNYSETKQGEKARFNHSFSAIVVEKDINQFHLRVLNADENGGFYDIDGYYDAGGRTDLKYVEALITGDEHALFASPLVKAATYTNKDSMVKVLKPKRIVRHDVLDCYSVSHHHKNNFLTKYGKHKTSTDIMEDELKLTLEHIDSTTPSYSENIIVASNHNDHLYRWLNEADPKIEPWNAKLYHHLMYRMLDKMTITDKTFEFMNPFELWVSEQKHKSKITFVGRDEAYKICEIEISNHGDLGTNGSRGSLLQYSRLAFKTIIGHSHSPGINKGAYQVGTSSNLKLEYSKGPSSWLNTHCVVYPNGKRQLIHIINGKWKK